MGSGNVGWGLCWIKAPRISLERRVPRVGYLRIASFDLSGVASSLTLQLRRPHVTGRVSLYMDTLTFPLRAAYDEARATLQCIRRPIESGQALCSFTGHGGISQDDDGRDDEILEPPPVPSFARGELDSDGICRDGSGEVYKLTKSGQR